MFREAMIAAVLVASAPVQARVITQIAFQADATNIVNLSPIEPPLFPDGQNGSISGTIDFHDLTRAPHLSGPYTYTVFFADLSKIPLSIDVVTTVDGYRSDTFRSQYPFNDASVSFSIDNGALSGLSVSTGEIGGGGVDLSSSGTFYSAFEGSGYTGQYALSNVTLTTAAVPETSTWLLLGSAFSLIGYRLRRGRAPSLHAHGTTIAT